MTPSNLSPQAIDFCWRFVRGDVDAPSFESWLYDAKDLDRALGPDAYLDAISVDFADAKQVANFKHTLKEKLPQVADCACHLMPSKTILPHSVSTVTAFEFVEREVSSLRWLHRVACTHCQTVWLAAIDSRIYDVWIMARGASADMPEVKTYHGLLETAVKLGANVRYDDPMNSVEIPAAINILAQETPGIALSTIVALLPVDHSVTRHHALNAISENKVRIDLGR